MVSVTGSRWNPNFQPPSSTNPLDKLWGFLSRYADEDHHPIVERRDNEIVLHHDWLLHDCWYAHDLSRSIDGVKRSEFTVRTKDNWHNPTPVTARFIQGEHHPTIPAPITLDTILTTLYNHYPWELGDVRAKDVEYRCGDVSDLFCEVLWQVHGIQTSTVSGGIYDQETCEGWPHGFVVLHPKWVDDIDAPVIIDGTAKQFCDEWSDQWPSTLAPENEISSVHVVRQDHPHRSLYTMDRSELVKPDSVL